MASQPNFVVLFLDDHGYGDFGKYNTSDPSDLSTPNLDALADGGLLFTDFHAGASVCTPSRAALLTGRLGARTGVYTNFSPYSYHGIPEEEITIAELLRDKIPMIREMSQRHEAST